MQAKAEGRFSFFSEEKLLKLNFWATDEAGVEGAAEGEQEPGQTGREGRPRLDSFIRDDLQQSTVFNCFSKSAVA